MEMIAIKDLNKYNNYTNANLKFLREMKEITQERISKDLKLDQSTLAKWENNSRKITLEWAINLAEYFNVNVGEFITIDMREKNTK